MENSEIKNNIEEVFLDSSQGLNSEIENLLNDFLNGLNYGSIRSAEKDENNNWNANIWVKRGILLLFRYGTLADMSINSNFKFFDKNTIPLKEFDINSGVRIVPGGSSIRNGSYIAKGVICMPPMYINIGSYVDEGTMVDSHALVGTCAQIGKRVHISAAAQIGGVLEPAGARPVIIEDDVLIGGNCGVYEGIIIRNRAILGSGVVLTASTKVFDLVNERVLESKEDKILEIPENAVVVPGSRLLKSEFGKTNGLSISSPLIIKYRDSKTDAKTALEETLRV